MPVALLLLVAVLLVALAARAATKVRPRDSSDNRGWLAGDDPSARRPAPGLPVDELAGRVPAGAAEPSADEPMSSTAADDGADPEGTPEEEPEVVATTSDGWDFVPDRDRVRLVRVLVDQLNPGDLVAARVTRDGPGLWLVEALEPGIDTGAGTCWPFRSWAFTSEEAARAAAEVLERSIVRAPRDENGEPRAFGDADFAEARRLTEQPLAELETASGEPTAPSG